jgi:hypothetical protein
MICSLPRQRGDHEEMFSVLLGVSDEEEEEKLSFGWRLFLPLRKGRPSTHPVVQVQLSFLIISLSLARSPRRFLAPLSARSADFFLLKRAGA